MPVYLKKIRDFQQLGQFQSVLIVPCRFCSADSQALRSNEPYFKLCQNLIQTAAYERYKDVIRSELGKRGVVADVFTNHLSKQGEYQMEARRKERETVLKGKAEVLIAIGAATAANCIPCFEHLYEKAVTSGVAETEIQRAAEIAGMVKSGAHTAISSAIDELIGSEEVNRAACGKTSAGSCGC